MSVLAHRLSEAEHRLRKFASIYVPQSDNRGVNQLLTTMTQAVACGSEQREPRKRGYIPMNVTAHLHLVETVPAISQAALAATDAFVRKCLSAFRKGDENALFELGCAFSTGSHGAICDLVEAHKWFNIAASRGHEEAQYCRAEVAEEMTAREIVEAQRRARAFLAESASRKVA